MAGEGVKVAIQRADIDRHPRHRLAAIEEKLGSDSVSEVSSAICIEHAAQHVGDVRERYHRVLAREHRLGGVEIDPAIGGQRADIDLPSGKLPRDDVRMMLELAEQHAPLVGILVRDQIDRLGRAAGEDDFVFRAPDEPRNLAPRSFVTQRHLSRARIHPAMHGGVVAAHRAGSRVDDGLRFLRGGGGIEVMPARAIRVPQPRKIPRQIPLPQAGGVRGGRDRKVALGRKAHPAATRLLRRQVSRPSRLREGRRKNPAHTNTSSRASAAVVSASSPAAPTNASAINACNISRLASAGAIPRDAM